jgi:hypothetical protein
MFQNRIPPFRTFDSRLIIMVSLLPQSDKSITSNQCLFPTDASSDLASGTIKARHNSATDPRQANVTAPPSSSTTTQHKPSPAAQQPPLGNAGDASSSGQDDVASLKLQVAALTRTTTELKQQLRAAEDLVQCQRTVVRTAPFQCVQNGHCGPPEVPCQLPSEPLRPRDMPVLGPQHLLRPTTTDRYRSPTAKLFERLLRVHAALLRLHVPSPC